MLKKVEAIIRRSALRRALEALEKVRYPGVTVSEVEGHGKQRGITQQYRDKSHQALIPKLRLEIVAEAPLVPGVVKALVAACQTGEIGDGKIFVSPVEQVVRVRTGEKGPKALW